MGELVTPIDTELVSHCLEGVGRGVPSCPIIAERNAAMSKDCDGLSISDKLFEFLVQAVQEATATEAKKEARARAEGQVDALAYSVAIIRNPYAPNVADIKEKAERVAMER